jgi:hypothetical protein
MKKAIIFILLIVFSCQLKAQTFDEWFRQKKTQIKYLLQQIAANQIYIDYLQKGYKIARGGLTTINDIKHGDFNLHYAFFDSLKHVNPKIRNWAKIGDIAAMQVQIINETKAAVHRSQSSKQFTSSELTYLQNVFSHLLDECSKDIDALLTVTVSGKAEMSDDERINRIDAIYEDMEDKLLFSKSFTDEETILGAQRYNEQTDIEVGKQLNAPFEGK